MGHNSDSGLFARSQKITCWFSYTAVAQIRSASKTLTLYVSPILSGNITFVNAADKIWKYGCDVCQTSWSTRATLIDIFLFSFSLILLVSKNIVHQRTFSSLQLSQQQLTAAQSKQQLFFLGNRKTGTETFFYTADSFHGFRTSVMIEFIMKNQSFKYMSKRKWEFDPWTPRCIFAKSNSESESSIQRDYCEST